MLLHQIIRGLGNLNFSRQPMGLHAAGHVDSVTPDIILKFLVADNSGDDRAGVDPDAKGGVAAFLFLLLVQEPVFLMNEISHQHEED